MRAPGWVQVALLAYCCSQPRQPPRPPSCSDPAPWDLVLSRCSAEYFWSHDPAIGIRAAMAASYLGDHDTAARLARPLLFGPHAADAEYVLGSAALARGALHEARARLERALALYAEAGKLAGQTRAAFQLAGAWFGLGEFGKALEAMAALRAAAQASRDHRMLVYADLGSADIHRAIGDQDQAEEEIQRAVDNAQHPDDRLNARFKQGVVQLEAGHHGLARQSFARVLADGDPASAQHARLLRAAQINLIEIDLKQGRPTEALRRLEAHRDDHDELTFRIFRGLALADLGRVAEARADLGIAEQAGPRGELSWWVPYQAALVEAKAGNTDAAIAASRRSIEKVTELAARSGTYGPKVIAAHRQPHFHLIGLHAARRQWREALDVVATLDAHALIDSRAAPAAVAPTSDAPLVLRAPARGALGDASTIAGAWRGRRLVVVVPGGGRAWQLVLRDGRLEGRDAGDLGRLEALARVLAEHPGDAAAGRALGEALLAGLAAEPAGAPDDRRIDLLVVGPLAGVALASLRLGDRLAISHLQIARVPGVLPRIDDAAPAAPGAPRAVVLGDPRGDLPASAAEAARLGARLGVEARVGPAATRAAFAAAAGAGLLHVSAHTKVDAGGGALVLADGELAAADLGRLGRAPRRVVLASCAAAAGTDDAGSGSLAHAFLDAGAEHVVATKWTIRDAEAARLVAAFYDAGGDRDPVAALAAAQQRLAGTLHAHTWASFEVLAARPAVR